MTLTHFIITRFCLRNPWPYRRRPIDPLAPRNVALRLRLLETICLPGLRSQTNRDFIWVLLIDHALDPETRQRLQALTRGMDRVRFCEYRADLAQQMQGLGWLAPLWTDRPDHVLTTINDDDDALPRRYVEVVRSHARDLAAQGRLPPFKLIGAKRIHQWDMVFTPDAPLGWVGPWRGAAVCQCGFSLLCRYPAFASSVLDLNHKFAETYCDFSTPPPTEHVRLTRQWLLQAAGNAAGRERLPTGRDAFFDASRDAGAVVMSNHGGNTRQRRMNLGPSARRPKGLASPAAPPRRVQDATAFPDVSIDWQAAQRHGRHFRPWRVRARRLEYILHKLPHAAGRRLRRFTSRLRSRIS